MSHCVTFDASGCHLVPFGSEMCGEIAVTPKAAVGQR